MTQSLGHIAVDSLLINNFVLTVFLGQCSFFGVSGKTQTALRMGISVMFVTTVSSVLAYVVNQLLVSTGTEYLRIIAYIVIIASAVQLTEMFIRKVSPVLFRELGVFLPLITTNCLVLAVPLFQTSRGYNLVQSIVFSLGATGGYLLAILLLSVVRERLEFSDVPDLAKGTALLLVIASILSLAFMGFAGIGGGG